MEIDYLDINKNNKIIDVRSTFDYDEFHINNSINVPKIKLLGSPETYLNKNELTYLICDRGKISMSCSKILNALGYNCISIKGGIESII